MLTATSSAPALLAAPDIDDRLPSQRQLRRVYDAYALAHMKLRAVYDPLSNHAVLSDDEREEMFEERSIKLIQCEQAFKIQDKRCATNTMRRNAQRSASRASETAQRHMFVDAWPDDFQAIGSRFPHRPLVANKPELDGSFYRPLHEAPAWLRVQYNPAIYAHLIVIDYDAPAGIDVSEIWKIAGLPRPNYLVRDPDSPTGHITYAIKTPIALLDATKAGAVRYAHAIWVAFTKALSGDLDFVQKLTKNPVNRMNAWEVEWLNPVPYTLHELASFVTLPKNSKKARKEALARELEDHEKVGLGRNCSVFYRVAHWSYSAIRQHWGGRFDVWTAAVREQCDSINASFPERLSASEVGQISRSIAGWTWTHTTPDGFSESQARLGKKGGTHSGVTRLAKAQVLTEEALILKAAGMTHAAIATKLDVSLRSVDGYLKPKKDCT